MARPKSWFERKEFATAKRARRDRKQKLWLYTRKLREGGTESGYYVGKKLPARLAHAEVELKAA